MLNGLKLARSLGEVSLSEGVSLCACACEALPEGSALPEGAAVPFRVRTPGSLVNV